MFNYTPYTNFSNSSTNSHNNQTTKLDPLKQRIIDEIISHSKNMTTEEMLPQIMQINTEMKKRNLSFTPEETKLILDKLEKNLSPEEKNKFQMIRNMI